MNDDRTDTPAPGREGVTLVLGGGGARGIAHLGVFQVLEREGIPLGLIVGNSAGSIVGAAVLQRETAAQTTEETLEFLDSPSFRRLKLSMPIDRDEPGEEQTFLSRMLSGWRRQVAMQLLFRRPALFHRRRLESVIHHVVDEGLIEDLRLPLQVVCLDLKTGELVALEHGSIRDALVASSAVPGFFPPVEIEGRTLIDSGHANNLPVPLPSQRNGGLVIAVNLSTQLPAPGQFESGIEIIFRAEEIGALRNNQLRSQLADIQIEPDLGGRHWMDFSKPREFVEAGIAATEKVLPRLLTLLGREPSIPPVAPPVSPETADA